MGQEHCLRYTLDAIRGAIEVEEDRPRQQQKSPAQVNLHMGGAF